MKKAISAVLAVIMLLSLAACGGKGEASDPNLGKYIGDQIEVLDWTPMTEVYAGENYIELKSGGKGTFCLDGEETDITWKLDGEALTFTAEGMDCNGTLKDGVITTDFFGIDMKMTFVKEGADSKPVGTDTDTDAAPAEDPAEQLTALQQWWNGDWYGWWTLSSCDGFYEENDWEGMYWDCCGTMDVDADGNGNLVLWDETWSKDYPLAEIELTVSEDSGAGEMGAAVTESGYFFDMQLQHADFIIDPSLCDYENFMVLEGWYGDTDGGFYLEVFLRPWGQDWSDVAGENTMAYDDMLPYYYSDWYLPLIEAGEPMPEVIGGDNTASGELPDDELEPQPTSGLAPLGWEGILGAAVPEGFTYNEEWWCYSNADYTVSLWLDDASTYSTLDEMESSMTMSGNPITDETMGAYTVHMVEDPENFYGPSTLYYVELGGVGGYAACKVQVSARDGAGIPDTQTQAIKDMIACIAEFS